MPIRNIPSNSSVREIFPRSRREIPKRNEWVTSCHEGAVPFVSERKYINRVIPRIDQAKYHAVIQMQKHRNGLPL